MVERVPSLENIRSQLGDFGTYQLRQHLLHLLTAFVAGVHMISLTFTAATPNHRCYIPQLDNKSDNPSMADLMNYIPLNKKGELDTCSKYRTVDDHVFTNETVTCDEHYRYDTTYYTSTRVVEWNLVCEQRWLRALLQSLYMLGVLGGAVKLGSLADAFGRKHVLRASAILQFVFGLVCAGVTEYDHYAVALFFYGAFGTGGAYGTCFVLSMELIGPSKRTVCGTMFSFVFALGFMAIPFWAWLFPDGFTLQIICAAHALLLLGHLWWVDESIKWLWGQGQIKKALDLASHAIAVNGKDSLDTLPVDLSSLSSIESIRLTPAGRIISNTGTQTDVHQQADVADLFRLPRQRWRLVVMCYSWFANSLVYYGLAFSIGTLPGNPFLMSFLNGLAEVPGYIIVITLLDRMGRRSLGSLLLFVGGFACLLIACIPKGVATITVAMLAKVAVAGSFSICFNYAAELFPTVVRNSVVGLTTMGARFAGMLAPDIMLLDSKAEYVPAVVFGVVAITSAFATLFLPETLGKEMPETLEDGEIFGAGDTAFKAIYRKIRQYTGKGD